MSKSSRPPSLGARARAAIIDGVILGLRSVTPISFLILLSYSAAAAFPAQVPLQLELLTRGKHASAAVLLFAAVEVLFALVYTLMAISVNRRHRPTSYEPRELRDVVKKVLESNMGPSPGRLSKENVAGGEVHCAGEPGSTEEDSYDDGLDAAVSEPSTPSSRRSSASGIWSRRSSSSEATSTTSSACLPSSDYNFLAPRLSAADPRAVDFRSQAEGWYYGAPFKTVWREDISQWMAWSLYGRAYESLVQERLKTPLQEDHVKDGDIGRDQLEVVDLSVDLYAARAGVEFREGKNLAVNVMRLTLDQARVTCRPFFLYALVWMAQAVYRIRLRLKGFSEEVHDGLTYHVRIPEGWSPPADEAEASEATRPLLFLHGLGVGLVQYAHIVNELAHNPSFSNRPIALLVQPHSSMSIFSRDYLRPPNAAACSRSFAALVKHNDFSKSGVTILSHSMGTIVHSWLVKAHPELVRRSCLADPVCFTLWEPALPFNFLHAAANFPSQRLMRFFVAEELGVANLLSRHFDWISNILWADHIRDTGPDNKTAVFLAERDVLIDPQRTASYLEAEGLRDQVTVFPRLKHGECIMSRGPASQTVIDWLATRE